MNSKDIKIISYLRQDARMPLTEMSRKTNMPVSTIFDRLKISKGLIMKSTCIIDFSKFGYNEKVSMIVRVTHSEADIFSDYMANHESVNSVYRLGEENEFMIEAIFKDKEELKRFLNLIESRFTVIDSKLYNIKEDIKREAFLTDPDMAIV